MEATGPRGADKAGVPSGTEPERPFPAIVRIIPSLIDGPHPAAVGKIEITIGSERHGADVREFGPCRRPTVAGEAVSAVTGHHPEPAIGQTHEDLVTCRVGHVERSGRTDRERAGSLEGDDRSDGQASSTWPRSRSGPWRGRGGLRSGNRSRQRLPRLRQARMTTTPNQTSRRRRSRRFASLNSRSALVGSGGPEVAWTVGGPSWTTAITLLSLAL